MLRPVRSFNFLVKQRSRWFVGVCKRRGLSYQAENASSITPVEKIILDTIKTTGPVSFATYMQLCLSHPTHGYYMNPANPVFGVRGDFTTSPEISQVFGELVGIWLLSQWMNFGRSSSFRLIELGPGRGTLMADVLRVVSQFPASKSALRQVHLVETSSYMRDTQSQRLSPLSQKDGWELHWHDSIEDIPRGVDLFTMLLAHEFFDALPVHLLEKSHKGWQEILVSSRVQDAVAPTTSVQSEYQSLLQSSTKRELHTVLAPSPTPMSTLLGLSSPRFQKLPIGARLEVSPAAFKVARNIGELLGGGSTNLKSRAGAALIVDYGGEKAFGRSIRAFRNHQIVDIFHRPGECDLTANVDFAYLKEAIAELATTHGILMQADFLERMGIQLRVDALSRAASSETRQKTILDATERLVDRTGMGTAYKVLGVTAGQSEFASEGNSAGTWPFYAR